MPALHIGDKVRFVEISIEWWELRILTFSFFSVSLLFAALVLPQWQPAYRYVDQGVITCTMGPGTHTLGEDGELLPSISMTCKPNLKGFSNAVMSQRMGDLFWKPNMTVRCRVIEVRRIGWPRFYSTYSELHHEDCKLFTPI